MNKKKIRRYLQELRYIVPTLYFNFHYLPFRQAIRLPIVLYKPHLLKCKGTIRLEPEDGRIRHGMIRLGFHQVSLYPNNGFTWENLGGVILVFIGVYLLQAVFSYIWLQHSAMVPWNTYGGLQRNADL